MACPGLPWRKALIARSLQHQGGSVNKLWWFIRNQIAKTISASSRFIIGRL